MYCDHDMMADPFNRERKLREQYRELREAVDEIATCLQGFIKLIQEAGGDSEPERKALDRFNRLKARHDR